MPLGKRQRKFLLGLCIGLAGILLLWLSLPLWFPWILRPAATRFGANYVRYHREGYGRVVLDEVTFTNSDIKIRADRIESVVPTVWLWRSAFGNVKQTFVSIKGWQLELNSDE